MMQNTNRAVGTAREQERAYANHRHRRGHRGGGPRRYFLRALPFGAGLHGAHRHGGQRLGGGGSRMPEAGGRAMRELRTLPYHDGVLGRGSVLGRRSGVQIARRILGTGRKLGFSVVLVRQVVDGGHRHGQRNDDGQREREHARENLAGQALNLEMRRAHARAHEEGLMQ